MAKRKMTSEAASDGGTLRARLRKRETYAQRDAERTRAKRMLDREMQGMGFGYQKRVKMCVYLDDDYFLIGMDEMNLTLFRLRKDKTPKLVGYYPRIAHLLHGYFEHRVNTAKSLKVEELVAVIRRVEDAIKALDGKVLVPVPAGDPEDVPGD